MRQKHSELCGVSRNPAVMTTQASLPLSLQEKAPHALPCVGDLRILRLVMASSVLAGMFWTAAAQAQGCLPAPTGGAGLPPCCSAADMSAGGSCMAPATRFQFTLFTFGFEKSDGTVIDLGAAHSFDAAGVDAGGNLGTYLAGVSLPPATYVAVRPTLSRLINVTTQATTRDGRVCSGSATAAALPPGGTAWPECTAGQPNGSVTACTAGAQLRLRDNQTGAMTVTGSGGFTLSVRFDVNNGTVCHFSPGSGPAGSITPGVLSLRVTKS